MFAVVSKDKLSIFSCFKMIMKLFDPFPSTKPSSSHQSLHILQEYPEFPKFLTPRKKKKALTPSKTKRMMFWQYVRCQMYFQCFHSFNIQLLIILNDFGWFGSNFTTKFVFGVQKFLHPSRCGRHALLHDFGFFLEELDNLQGWESSTRQRQILW